MKPHPQIRKAIKWGGAAVTLLLVVVWIASGWVSVYWQSTSRFGLGISAGLVGIDVSHVPVVSNGFSFDAWTGWPGPGWHINTRTYDMVWRLTGVKVLNVSTTSVPLWMIVVPLVGATSCAWRFDMVARRRARTTHCPKCSYDRAGLAASAKCPECGDSNEPRTK